MNFGNFDFLLNIIFPRQCISCGENIRDGTACTTCLNNISIYRALFCAVCGAQTPPRQRQEKPMCHKDAPYLLGAAASYENPTLRALIHALKFRSVRSAAEPIAALLANYTKVVLPNLQSYIVTPIPLSKKRERSRGFNQSALVAYRFAHHRDIPFMPDIIARTRDKKPQSETKSAAERRENVRGVFAPTMPDSAKNKNIILIDDVTTSGATFREAAIALRDAGAQHIIALAAARA